MFAPPLVISAYRLCLERIATWEEYKLESDTLPRVGYQIWKYEVLANWRSWRDAYLTEWPCLYDGTCRAEEA